MEDKIFMWDDDNHEPCIWINNEFAGIDLDTVIESALYSKPKSEIKKCITLKISPWDFEDDFNDDDFDKLFDWFQSMPKFTDKQWELIFKQQWQELFKTL